MSLWLIPCGGLIHLRVHHVGLGTIALADKARWAAGDPRIGRKLLPGARQTMVGDDRVRANPRADHDSRADADQAAVADFAAVQRNPVGTL